MDGPNFQNTPATPSSPTTGQVTHGNDPEITENPPKTRKGRSVTPHETHCDQNTQPEQPPVQDQSIQKRQVNPATGQPATDLQPVHMFAFTVSQFITSLRFHSSDKTAEVLLNTYIPKLTGPQAEKTLQALTPFYELHEASRLFLKHTTGFTDWLQQAQPLPPDKFYTRNAEAYKHHRAISFGTNFLCLANYSAHKSTKISLISCTSQKFSF